jgi:hypothetical protein
MKKQKFNDYSFPAGRVRKAEELIEFTPPDSKEGLQDVRVLAQNAFKAGLAFAHGLESNESNFRFNTFWEQNKSKVNNYQSLVDSNRELLEALERAKSAFKIANKYDKSYTCEAAIENIDAAININNAKELNK